MQKQNQNKTQRWIAVIAIIIALSMISLFSALIIGFFISSEDTKETGNIALISIKGIILPDSAGSMFQSNVADSTTITELIEQANKNKKIKAIILEINSPGGTPVATYEIAAAIKNSNKTTVAWIRETALSGGYWIASSCDYIVSNPMSLTGSVGVISSYLEFSEFLDNHSIKYQRLVAGKYKDISTPLKKLTTEEELVMQKNLDKLHTYFLSAVAENRKLSKENINEVSSAMIYLGIDAKKIGLVDKLGGKKEVIEYIENKEKITADIAKYKKQKSLTEILTGVMTNHGYSIGAGMSDNLISDKQSTFKI